MSSESRAAYVAELAREVEQRRYPDRDDYLRAAEVVAPPAQKFTDPGEPSTPVPVLFFRDRSTASSTGQIGQVDGVRTAHPINIGPTDVEDRRTMTPLGHLRAAFARAGRAWGRHASGPGAHDVPRAGPGDDVRSRGR